MKNLVQSEFRKLLTTRTMWALLGAIAAVTALSVTASMVAVNPQNLDRESEEGLRAVLHVAGSGAIFVLMLGIIVTAGEYRQRTAVDTFLTTPRRTRVLVAKLVASISTGVAFGAVATLIAIITAVISYQSMGLSMPLTLALTWSTVAGSAIYAALFGGLGASIGSLIRNQIVAIITAIVLIIIAEPMIFMISPAVGRWFPAALGRSIVSDPGGDYLAPWPAGLLLAFYVVIIMLATAAIESRRDA